ncbi:hypothetical protein [Streptomyces sp. DSM 15324]|uniref:hypothetical protein n=1 Tax=Streptomyces sp. DSM 15324 TaxID=1739111 RepID=UPI000B1DAEAB|nr:hypothetical protein [Streptomyces sp. DSM 15324]
MASSAAPMNSGATQTSERGTTPGDLKARAAGMASRLPAFRGRDLVFYGGLGALAIAGALEWPVALAVGGATYVVTGGWTRQETQARAGETAGAGETAEAGRTGTEQQAAARRAG